MYAAETLIDEKALVLRLIDGDEDAFCELYAAYKGRLIYFAMRFLKSREHAEDVFQDAFTVIWQSRRFINPDASFSSYPYTIFRKTLEAFLKAKPLYNCSQPCAESAARPR